MNDILKEELIYQGRICKFTHDTVTFEDGSTGHRDVLHLPGAVAVIAENNEGKLLFVSQYRHAVETELLEIPAGMLEKGENPELAALRELQEETGYKASKIEKLVEFFTSPGVVKEKIYVYMASDLTFVGQHLDADEYINVKTYTAEEVEKMINNNELQDGKSIIAYELWKNRKSL
ncbi:MAG: NUDIX hydrolase [Erysipelotrichaceae bacterium]|nr:NUDIX hydrolase [Erysipelotrichaceae bacterium]